MTAHTDLLVLVAVALAVAVVLAWLNKQTSTSTTLKVPTFVGVLGCVALALFALVRLALEIL